MADEHVSIIKKLPAIFQEEGGFLENFLKAFEASLLGDANADSNSSRAVVKSIDYLLRNQDKYFDAYRTPPQFLEWLAGWVGYEFRKGEEFNDSKDITENSFESPIKQHLPLPADRTSFNRFFISEMVSVYQRRGTRNGINRIINDYLGNISYPGYNVIIKSIINEVRIDEYLQPFVLGENSRVEQDTILGEPRPYYFRLIIIVDSNDPALILKIVNDIRNILSEEIPAHTYYFFTASNMPSSTTRIVFDN